MDDNNTDTVFIVKGRSGINFLVTQDFEKAKKLQNDIDGASIEHWINEKHIFTS